MHKIASRLNYSTPEDLLAGLGFGETGVTSVVNKLRESTRPATDTDLDKPQFRATPATPKSLSKESREPIRGVEGMPHHIAKCCNPLPGDDILGLVTLSGRGIAIHRQDCPNLVAAIEAHSDRLLPVSWNESHLSDRAPTYPVELQVEAIDRVGVLKDILARLSDLHINVSNAKVKTNPGKPAIIRLSIDVAHKDQLKNIIDRLRQLSDVLDLKCDRRLRNAG